MTAALVFEDVHKRYGQQAALSGLSFSAPRGAITGLIGPNGAGKTTCFSVVGGLIWPDSGRVDVLGKGPFEPSARGGELGLLPQDAQLPSHARVAGLLTYLVRLQGFSRRAAEREVERVLDAVSLTDQRDKRLSDLSHGMRRRVAVAQTLLGDPPLVVLDEPTAGLDPHLVASMRELLLQIRRAGRSLLVSSHVLAELEAICDHVVFLEAGKCVRSGDLAMVTGRDGTLRLRVSQPVDLEHLRQQLPDLQLSQDGDLVLWVQGRRGQQVAEISRQLLPEVLATGAGVMELSAGHSLEQAYLDTRR